MTSPSNADAPHCDGARSAPVLVVASHAKPSGSVKGSLPPAILVTEPLLVALPAADPLAARITIRLPDLAGRRMPNGSPADSGDTAPPPPPGSALVKDLSQLFNLVEVGELVWFLPAWVARRFPRPNIANRPVLELPPATLAVAWLSESRSPAVAAFVRTAHEMAAAAASHIRAERAVQR